jgi:molecular chaperone GrpE
MDEFQTPGTTTESEAVAGPPGELEQLRRELQDKQDRLLRALAETDNVRRRAQRDREDYVKFAAENLLRDLIPVLDNLDRALAAARATGEATSVAEGVELIQREMLRVLERSGLTRYSAQGQRFDPARHEAIARMVSAEAAPDTVLHETAPGYLLHGRVLRPAMVAVAAAPDSETP